MGRARSRRRRGKTGGAGSGGSGKGKGTGGSRGRSSNNRGGQGKGGSGTGGTGGSRGRSNNTRGGQAKANRNQNMKANKAVAKAKTVAKVAGKLGKDFANDPKGFPSRHLTGFIGEQPANATDLGSRIGTSIANSPLAHKYNQVDNYVNPRHPRVLKRLQEKTGRDYNTKIKAGEINLSTKALADFVGISDKDWYKNNVPGFIRNARVNKQLYGHPTVKGWHSSQRTGRGQGLKINKDIIKATLPIIEATKARQAQKDQQKAEEKALDKQYKQDQAIYNNNKKNMSVTISQSTGGGSGPQQQSDSDWLNQQYLSKFGRSADTKTKGGASYWLDQMAKNPTTHSRDEVARMLGASAEAKSFAGDGVVRPGGVRRDQSVYSQGVAGQEYAKHFQPGGALAGLNSADTLNQIAANTFKPMPEGSENEAGITAFPGVDGGYFQFADQDVVAQPTLPGAPKVPGTDGWWSQFADADAFKKFLSEGQQPAKSDGMGDFMKFMMLMNVMGGGRGGGGGYGGSQFGYGGLNAGGVQAAYDPMANLQSMGTWFKDNFGSGSGATTNTVNTGTA